MLQTRLKTSTILLSAPVTILVAALQFSSGISAHAHDNKPPLSKGGTYQRCIDQSGGITATMRECAANEYRRLDRELNIVWRKTMARLSDARARERLRAAQRQWLKTRKSECDRQVADSGMNGGTGALLIADTCAISQLETRIAWLGAYR